MPDLWKWVQVNHLRLQWTVLSRLLGFGNGKEPASEWHSVAFWVRQLAKRLGERRTNFSGLSPSEASQNLLLLRFIIGV
jgi:hypothetical protein